jgi:hypothetical protein
MNERFLAVIFVILASLAAIHIMGKRFPRSAPSHVGETRAHLSPTQSDFAEPPR